MVRTIGRWGAAAVLALVVAVLGAAGGGMSARAQEGDGAASGREAAIRGVIGSQLDAFEADDVDRAFGFASNGIRGMFGTPERFGQMVREGYPMVWRPGEVRYLELREVAGRLWQRVMIVDRAGRLHMLDYQMIEAADGWRINGVQVLRGESPGV